MLKMKALSMDQPQELCCAKAADNDGGLALGFTQDPLGGR